MVNLDAAGTGKDTFANDKRAQLEVIEAEIDRLDDRAEEIRKETAKKRQEALEILGLGFGYGLVVSGLIGLAGLAELLEIGGTVDRKNSVSAWILWIAMTMLLVTLVFALVKGWNAWVAQKRLGKSAEYLEAQSAKCDERYQEIHQELRAHLREQRMAQEQAEELARAAETAKEAELRRVEEQETNARPQTARGSTPQSDQNAKRNPKGGSGR